MASTSMPIRRPSHLREKPPSAFSKGSSQPPTRDSNMVRASVLDAALELGFGGPNSTVANWMFNSPVLEEEEEQEEVTIYSISISCHTSWLIRCIDTRSRTHPFNCHIRRLPFERPFFSIYPAERRRSVPIQHQLEGTQLQSIP